MEVRVSGHAAERYLERTSWRLADMGWIAARARTKGLPQAEATGALREYLDGYPHPTQGRDAYVYSHYVMIYAGDVLVTIYDLPPRYREQAIRQAARLKRRRRKGEGKP